MRKKLSNIKRGIFINLLNNFMILAFAYMKYSNNHEKQTV